MNNSMPMFNMTEDFRGEQNDDFPVLFQTTQ